MEKKEHELQGKELVRFNVTKKFRLYALTAKGQELYLGRHEIEVGRDDITSVVVVEEND